MRPTTSPEDILLMTTLGNNLKKYRQLRGMTQSQFAEAMHVNRVTIARIESGKRMPSIPFVVAAAGHLRCGVDDLVSEASESLDRFGRPSRVAMKN